MGLLLTQAKGNRTGFVFPLRMTAEQRNAFELARARTLGPRALGPWLLWAAATALRARVLPARARGTVLEPVLPELAPASVLPARAGRPVILDLCAGSGAWSEPYVRAGYEVLRVTLPASDVRTFDPPASVHGVLAAPPCTEFSIAKNGQERDLLRGLECVTACLRIIALARPVWWALENPGRSLLARFLGAARMTFEPHEFGDAWTKRTALWGNFSIPERGPFVAPVGSAMQRGSAAAQAITPPGFARAFFLSNP